MKLTYLLILCMMIASAAAASVGLNENNNNDINLNTLSAEGPTEDHSSKINRRSIGLFFGNLNPFRSLVSCRLTGRNYNHRQHNHHHSDPYPRYNHGNNYNRWHGHQTYQKELPLVTTSTANPRFIPATPTVGKTQDPIVQSFDNQPAPTSIPTTNLITSTVPTTTTTIMTPLPIITSSSTPKYKDPDNELIYDIDLRYRL